jgi:tRNA(Ile)-lysidine synthase
MQAQSACPYHRMVAIQRTISRVSRRDPVVARVALAWRDLTGGRARGRDLCRRTVLACSGGGDSCGLALALAAAVPAPRAVFVIAHIVHDLRPAEESLADRDAAAALAEALGLPFVEERIAVRSSAGTRENLEAKARRLRYQALAEIAARHNCHFIATAHHAQDQLETLLMAMLRGAGPRGMRGAARSRQVPETGVRLVRPALDVESEELRRLCRDAGWAWREDLTNADVSRLRAAVRHRILPLLEELRPGVARRAGRTARLMAEADHLVSAESRALLDGGLAERGFAWERVALRERPAIIIGAVLRAAAAELARGAGRDRVGLRVLGPMIRAIRDRGTDPRRFPLGRDSVLTVTANLVTVGSREG